MARSLLQSTAEYARNRIESLTDQREAALAKQQRLLHEAYLNPHEWGKGQMIPRDGRDAEEARSEFEKTTKALEKTVAELADWQTQLKKAETDEKLNAIVQRHRERDDDDRDR